MTALTDPALAALIERAGIDPAEGLQLIALDRLAARPFDAGMPLVVLPPTGVAPDPDDAYFVQSRTFDETPGGSTITACGLSRIHARLPSSVLNSPLCATIRNGCAMFHSGSVFVA